MIKYNLKCLNDHEFESWFSDSEEFDKLNKKKLLECIYCSSNKISKTIMAPMISSQRENSLQIELINKNLQSEKKKLIELRRFVEKNYEFVGSNFSKKVREIYYDKKNKKTIYGTTTAEERKEAFGERKNTFIRPKSQLELFE